MARKPLIAGNWKMNKSRSDLQEYFVSYFAALGENLQKVLDNIDVMFAPPAIFLSDCKQLTSEKNIKLGIQNLFFEKSGAFTGEHSIGMAKDFDVSFPIVGHSERRQFFGESDEIIGKKVSACLEHGLKPILCVGETLEERKEQKTHLVIEKQIKLALSGLGNCEGLVVAYEPVWAIGTGLSATSKEAQDVHGFIREMMSGLFGGKVAEKVRILYGGSVSPINARELLEQHDIDGALVGGASLRPLDFAQITMSAYEVVS